METKKNSGSPRPALSTVIVRLAAGGYLVYLAFGLFQEIRRYPKPVGGPGPLAIAAAVLFAVVGAALAVWSLKKLIKGEYMK